MSKVYILVIYNNQETRIINVLRRLDQAKQWKDAVDAHLTAITASRDYPKYRKEHQTELNDLCIPNDHEYTNTAILESSIVENYKSPMVRDTKTLSNADLL